VRLSAQKDSLEQQLAEAKETAVALQDMLALALTTPTTNTHSHTHNHNHNHNPNP
jgi:DNA recombination-dependent growth factor C